VGVVGVAGAAGAAGVTVEGVAGVVVLAALIFTHVPPAALHWSACLPGPERAISLLCLSMRWWVGVAANAGLARRARPSAIGIKCFVIIMVSSARQKGKVMATNIRPPFEKCRINPSIVKFAGLRYPQDVTSLLAGQSLHQVSERPDEFIGRAWLARVVVGIPEVAYTRTGDTGLGTRQTLCSLVGTPVGAVRLPGFASASHSRRSSKNFLAALPVPPPRALEPRATSA
jgi:hypothetical protein